MAVVPIYSCCSTWPYHQGFKGEIYGHNYMAVPVIWLVCSPIWNAAAEKMKAHSAVINFVHVSAYLIHLDLHCWRWMVFPLEKPIKRHIL